MEKSTRLLMYKVSVIDEATRGISVNLFQNRMDAVNYQSSLETIGKTAIMNRWSWAVEVEK